MNWSDILAVAILVVILGFNLKYRPSNDKNHRRLDRW